MRQEMYLKWIHNANLVPKKYHKKDVLSMQIQGENITMYMNDGMNFFSKYWFTSMFLIVSHIEYNIQDVNVKRRKKTSRINFGCTFFRVKKRPHVYNEWKIVKTSTACRPLFIQKYSFEWKIVNQTLQSVIF